MRIQLSDHFTYKKLLRFTLPTVLMLVCTSMYSVVDGFFVSNFVGKTSFAAVNLIFPVSMGVAALGFMLGTGGSAVVAKTIGEGKKRTGESIFFHGHLCGYSAKHDIFSDLRSLYATDRTYAWGRGYTASRLYYLRESTFCSGDRIYSSEYVPELFCRGGETGA